MGKPSRSEEGRGFQALLEQIESHVKAFGEQVLSLNERFDRVANQFDRRLTALDEKVDLHTRTIVSTIGQSSQHLTRELLVLGSRLDVHERSHLG